jgi:hypothetical protein
MFYRRDNLSVLIGVLLASAMAYQLIASAGNLLHGPSDIALDVARL